MKIRGFILCGLALAACSSSAAKTAEPATLPPTIPAATAQAAAGPTAVPVTAQPTTAAPATTAAPITTTMVAPTPPPTTTTTTIPPTTTTTLPPTAPPPTVDPMETARQAYLAIVKPGNDLRNAWLQRFPKSIPWATVPEYCQQYAVTDEKQARDFQAYPWPEAAKVQVLTLASLDAQTASLEYQCAKSPGTATAQTTLSAQRHALDLQASNAASAARLVLGLPIDR